MINILAFVQVKAFARQYAIFLSILWTASMAATMMAPQSSWGSLMALCTPFLMAWFTIRFREGALDGKISFRRAFAFNCYTFFYASLIFALIQFVYFKWLDQGRFLQVISEGVRLLEAYSSQRGGVAQYKTGLQLMSQMSAIQLAFTFMMQNLFIGFIISFPIAFFCHRK